MVNPRMRCVCCALPHRVLEHVARKTGSDAAQRHRVTSDAIRSQRHAHAAESTRPPAGGARRRFIYDAQGKEQLPGHLVRSEGDPPVRDDAVNGAYDNVGVTLDFFTKVYGRNSLDGEGMDVKASVHFGDRYPNAMWDGTQMRFGDGGAGIGGFTRCLDIVAHELTHAVTHHAVAGGLGVIKRAGKYDLQGEAGALNESISDVFGSLVKQWHRKQDVQQADWLIGEGLMAPELGRAIRSLKTPGDARVTYDDDDQVPDMRGFEEGADVHRNAGIPSHAFYLAAHTLGGHAWEHAGRIWYEAIALLHSHATFADAAKATVDTAARVFGPASKEQHAVRAAWQKVGVLRA